MGHEPEPPEPEKLREAALSPFDRRVAVTIAALTAVLAFASMLDSSTHSEVSTQQSTANRLRIEANASLTESQEFQTLHAASRETLNRREDTIRVIRLLPVEASGRAARDAEEQSLVKSMEGLRADAAAFKSRSEAKQRDADEFHRRSHEALEKAERLHREGQAIDRGELLLQLAIVMCSLAILTKRRWYWYAGMVLGAGGLVVARVATSVAPMF